MLWSFIIWILPGKTSAYPPRDIPEVGPRFRKNWISASWYVPIVIVKSMLKRSPTWKRVGEQRANSGKP
jgi:hypothetical protein